MTIPTEDFAKLQIPSVGLHLIKEDTVTCFVLFGKWFHLFFYIPGMGAQELWHIINIYKWVQNVKCIHIKFLVYFCEILCIKFKLWTLFMSCWHYLPHVAVGGGSSLDVTLGLAPADNGLVTRLSPPLPRLPGQEGAHDEAGHRPPPHCSVWLLMCYASPILQTSAPIRIP